MTQEAIPKIEGHAAFYANLKLGKVEEARIIGMENDRFIEKILYGRKYYEAPVITSRICGICPTIHNITSTKAIEAACGIIPTEQTILLRKLMLCGQMIQSHSLHLYLLVLPDFVGVRSSFELQKNHPLLFKNAVMLKQFADKVLDTFGGRAVHPISNVPGGFTSFPTKDSLTELAVMGEQIYEIAQKTVELFASLEHPLLKQKVVYSALHTPYEYAFYEGEIKTTNNHLFQPKNYTNYFYEELKPYTRAKFATIKGQEVMVGAMARLNINNSYLDDETKAFYKKYVSSHSTLINPFSNILAQALENFYFVSLVIKNIKQLLKDGIDRKEPVKPPKKFSIGTSACEAPRGTLLHHYELDKNGYIVKCDIITPTVQNLPPLEQDMKNLGPLLKGLKPKERDKIIEMLIRAYDPCITCATH